MEKQIYEKKIGSDGEFELEFKDGKLRLILGLDSKGVDAGVFVDLEPEYFLDKLKKAIPGELDDAIINMIKGALKA